MLLVKMRSHWVRVGPKCNLTGVLIRSGGETQAGRTPWEDTGRGWSDAVTSKGSPATTRSWDRAGSMVPSEPLGGANLLAPGCPAASTLPTFGLSPLSPVRGIRAHTEGRRDRGDAGVEGSEPLSQLWQFLHEPSTHDRCSQLQTTERIIACRGKLGSLPPALQMRIRGLIFLLFAYEIISMKENRKHSPPFL